MQKIKDLIIFTKFSVIGYRNFTKGGFENQSKKWGDELNLQGKYDLKNKNILITGASSGLGKSAALSLAKMNANVYMLCRNLEKSKGVLQEIVELSGNENVKILVVDVSSLDSIRTLVDEIEKQDLKFDILINNAGVLLDKLERKNGLELTFVTNTLGGFLLTNLLIAKKLYRAGARIISVSSGGMYNVGLNVDDLNLNKVNEKNFDGSKAYAFTKRQQVILTSLWAQKFNQDGLQFYSMHPGWADTPGVETSLPSFYKNLKKKLRSPEQGMDTAIWLACTENKNLINGQFYFDREIAQQHMLSSTESTKEQNEKFWKECCQIVGQEF